jgi:hypothetical protein
MKTEEPRNSLYLVPSVEVTTDDDDDDYYYYYYYVNRVLF